MGAVGAFGFYVNGKDKVTSSGLDGQPESLGVAVFEFVKAREPYQLKGIAEEIEFVKADDKPSPIHGAELSEQIMELQATEDTPFPYRRKNMSLELKGEEFLKQIDNIPFKHMSLEGESEEFDAFKSIEEDGERIDRELQETKEQLANMPEFNFTWADWLSKLQAHMMPLAVGFRYVIDQHELLADSRRCKWAYIINVDEECLEIYVGDNIDPNARGRYASLETGQWQGVALILTLDFERCRQMMKEHFVSIVEKEADEYLDTHRA